MKISFSFLLDCFLSFFVLFILCFILLNFFLPRPFSIIFSVVLSLLSCIIICKKLIEKDKNKNQNAKEKKERNKMCAQFNFATKCEVNDFFERIINKKGYKTERKKSGIFIKSKSLAVFIFFGFVDVNKSQIVKVFNSITSADTAYVLSENFTQDIREFAKRFDGRIILKDANEIYQYLKENDSLPPQKYEFTDKKPKAIELFKNLLDKKKAKRFFALGFLFIIFSYFVPIKTYYLVFGCLFLLFALFLTIFGKAKTD